MKATCVTCQGVGYICINCGNPDGDCTCLDEMDIEPCPECCGSGEEDNDEV